MSWNNLKANWRIFKTYLVIKQTGSVGGAYIYVKSEYDKSSVRLHVLKTPLRKILLNPGVITYTCWISVLIIPIVLLGVSLLGFDRNQNVFTSVISTVPLTLPVAYSSAVWHEIGVRMRNQGREERRAVILCERPNYFSLLVLGRG